MTIDVTLAIRADALPAGQTTITAVMDLGALGGRLVTWSPDLNGAPAKARFVFTTEAARNEFIAAATTRAGISVVTSSL